VTDRTLEQMRTDVELAREATLESLDRVRQGFVEIVDWRAHYQRHSWQWLAVAAGLGFFIGYQTRK
jgi:ElaB/YqjD/DUF883 family membrane-anchored ribosome-binding protein